MSEELSSTEADKHYDRAITLVQYYVQLLWLVFSAFLLAETVLMGAIATVAKEGPDGFVFGGALLGLFLILPWWTSFRYNHALYTLRVYEARSFEPKEGAGRFFSSGRVLIESGIASAYPEIHIPRLARFLAPRRAISLLIWVFAASFIVILVNYRPARWRATEAVIAATQSSTPPIVHPTQNSLKNLTHEVVTNDKAMTEPASTDLAATQSSRPAVAPTFPAAVPKPTPAPQLPPAPKPESKSN